MNPHLGHYIVAAVGMICMTVVIVLGHGNVIVQIAAGLGGASGIAALLMRSVKGGDDASK